MNYLDIINFTILNISKDLESAFIPFYLESFILNDTRVEILPSGIFKNHSIKNIVIENNPLLDEINNETFEGINNLKNLTIRKNLQLKWPEFGNSLFYVFSYADNIEVLDLEANNISFKG